MIIDILFLILVIMAVIKGMSRGLIVGIISLLSFLIGLAAAVKLSAVAASSLHQRFHLDGKWLPVFSFLLVFILVIWIVGLLARMARKAVRLAFLGWLDSLGGIILYVLLYMMMYSILLFYATQLHLISADTIVDSKSYRYIAPMAPQVLDALGSAIPFFKNMFADLKEFFGGVSHRVK